MLFLISNIKLINCCVFKACAGAGFVKQIYCLIGQITVGHISFRKQHCLFPTKRGSPRMFHGGKKLPDSILRSQNQWKETSLPKRVLTQSTFLANMLLCTHSTQVLEQLFRFLIWPFSSALSCIITNVFLEKQRKGIELFHSSSAFFREMSRATYHWDVRGELPVF